MEIENECCDSEFSEKISILLVDDDINCLVITSELLKKENYKVVTVKNANDAMSILRVSGNSFDLVITDVHMPEMNGFQLQQQITKEFDIPVVFMSEDDTEYTITKGLESGGAFFILKPVSQDDIRDLWQYAIMERKKKNIGKQGVVNEKSPLEEIGVDSSSSVNEESHKRGKSKRKHDKDENERNVHTPPKKSKLIWTEYLHNKFLQAITILGLKRAYPKRILQVMNIPELTRENVGSHLQKYRLYLQKVITPINTSPKLISTTSKNTFGNVNQLSTRKATDPISIQLMNNATTSAQQLTINYLNSAAAHNAKVTNFQSDPKDKKFADMLSYRISQEYRHKLNNIYSMPNSATHMTSALSNQMNVQPSIMENNNMEEGTNLSFVNGSNQYQQPYFSWTDHILNQQENYGGINVGERSFQIHNALQNSEFEQNNHEGFLGKERPFHFHNAPMSLELEQNFYGGVTSEKRSFQFHNDLLNSTLEQKNYERITANEKSFHPHI